MYTQLSQDDDERRRILMMITCDPSKVPDCGDRNPHRPARTSRLYINKKIMKTQKENHKEKTNKTCAKNDVQNSPNESYAPDDTVNGGIPHL